MTSEDPVTPMTKSLADDDRATADPHHAASITASLSQSSTISTSSQSHFGSNSTVYPERAYPSSKQPSRPSVDVLSDAVGRRMKVPSTWFGPEFARDHPDQDFVLDCICVQPETKSNRRRLLMMFEHEPFYSDARDFPNTVKPYLLDSSTKKVEKTISGGLTRSTTFGKVDMHVQFTEHETYHLPGRYVTYHPSSETHG